MNMNDAVHLWRMHGWDVDKRMPNATILVYDEGGGFARSIDRDKGRGCARACLFYDTDTLEIRSRLLNKATTPVLYWIRYLMVKQRMINAQNAELQNRTR